MSRIKWGGDNPILGSSSVAACSIPVRLTHSTRLYPALGGPPAVHPVNGARARRIAHSWRSDCAGSMPSNARRCNKQNVSAGPLCRGVRQSRCNPSVVNTSSRRLVWGIPVSSADACVPESNTLRRSGPRVARRIAVPSLATYLQPLARFRGTSICDGLSSKLWFVG